MSHEDVPCCTSTNPDSSLGRRGLLGATAAAVAGGALLGLAPAARAAAAAPAPRGSDSDGLAVVLLGTNGGPPPLAARFGISTALVVGGRTYLIDCGRGSLSQYMRAGLDVGALSGIFLTHLHSDHVVDYFSYPLLLAPLGLTAKIPVYGPGPAGEPSLLADAPGPLPGTAAMTAAANEAYAASSTFFLQEYLGVDPTSMLDVHEIAVPASANASLGNPAPTMAPFTVFEDDTVKVSATLVPHGAVFPAFAYRFDTAYGSVAFSGDTALTPNIPKIAAGVDVLVHEVVDLAYFEASGGSSALLTHLQKVHTDVTELGAIAAESGAGRLLATHLGPGDPTLLSDAAWNKALRASARSADYRGGMTLGADLMRIQIPRKK